VHYHATRKSRCTQRVFLLRGTKMCYDAFICCFSRSKIMATKVYWKGLEIVANTLRRYIQRNQIQLQANLTEEQYTCVTDLLQAVLSCLAILPSNTPT